MVDSPSTSLSLLSRLRGGDAEAWNRLNRLYRPLFRAWLGPSGLQLADIDDVTQNALAIVLRRLPDFHHNGRIGAFRTWLRGISANVLRDHLRSTKRRPPDDDKLLAEIEDPDSGLNRCWNVEHDRHVLYGLMQLVRSEFAETSWEAFRATALEGKPASEVAKALGLTPNAVRIARSRVLARLRQEALDLLDDL